MSGNGAPVVPETPPVALVMLLLAFTSTFPLVATLQLPMIGAGAPNGLAEATTVIGDASRRERWQ